MNIGNHELFLDENTPPLLSPGGANKSTTPQKLTSPFNKKSILRPTTKENLLDSPVPPVDKGHKVKFQPEPTTHSVTPTRYEDIRELDHLADWKERVTVVTKLDHEQYTNTVRELLDELVDNLPLPLGEPLEKQADSSPVSDLSIATPQQDVNSEVQSEKLLDSESLPVLDSTYTAEPEAAEPSAVQNIGQDLTAEPTAVPDQDLTAEPQVVPDQLPISEPQPTSEQVVTAEPTSQSTQAAEQLVSEPPGTAGDITGAVSTPGQPEVQPSTVDTEPASQVPADTTPSEQPEPVVTSTAEPVIPVSQQAQSAVQESPDTDEIPLAKGSYNIDWDNFDDSIDPFATKTKIVDPDLLSAVSKKPSADIEAKPAAESEPSPPSQISEPVSGSAPEELVSTPATAEESSDAAVESKTEAPAEPEETENSLLSESELLQADSDILSEVTTDKPSAPEPLSTDPFEASLLTEQLPSLDLEALPAEGATEAESKMSDPESEAIPLPKGSYNIDWDNFDENINPFESKSKVTNGPAPNKNSQFEDPTVDPFKPKKKTMMHSPPTSPSISQPEDPFQTRNKMASSPTLAPAKSSQESADINQNVETPTKAPPAADVTEEQPREGGPHDLDQRSLQDVEKKSPKKKPTPVKKGPKRFKPPARFTQNAQQGSDEIEIFAPPPPKTDSSNEDTQIESKLQPIDHSSPEVRRPKELDGVQAVSVDDDEFRSATEVFNDPATWEMLEKLGSANNSEFKESALARQSLYVKFDPLVKGQSPVKTSRIPSAEAIPEGEESLLLMGTPPPNKQGRPKHPAARVLEEQISAREAPEEKGSPKTPTDGTGEVDRLFACSPAAAEASSRQNGASPVKQNDTMTTSTDSLDIVHVLKYSQADLNRIKKEMELDYQARVLAKERDLQKQQESWDNQKSSWDNEIKNLQKQNSDMKTVVTEYEMTMTQLIAEKESSSSASKESMADLVKERDQALEDLHNVETAFSDLHRRFEKSKAAIEGFKKNEDTFKKCVNDQQQKMKKQEEKYQALKKHAEDKLEQANTELERLRKSTQSEITRMQAALKRAELQNQSLEQQVEQKVKENKELTAICDELINKVDQ